MNGGMTNWVGRWQKIEELFRNGFREEIGLPMIETGQRSGCEPKLQKEWRTGDGESDWLMISRVTKR